jgi:hypothetical protein
MFKRPVYGPVCFLRRLFMLEAWLLLLLIEWWIFNALCISLPSMGQSLMSPTFNSSLSLSMALS